MVVSTVGFTPPALLQPVFVLACTLLLLPDRHALTLRDAQLTPAALGECARLFRRSDSQVSVHPALAWILLHLFCGASAPDEYFDKLHSTRSLPFCLDLQALRDSVPGSEATQENANSVDRVCAAVERDLRRDSVELSLRPARVLTVLKGMFDTWYKRRGTVSRPGDHVLCVYHKCFFGSDDASLKWPYLLGAGEHREAFLAFVAKQASRDDWGPMVYACRLAADLGLSAATLRRHVKECTELSMQNLPVALEHQVVYSWGVLLAKGDTSEAAFEFERSAQLQSRLLSLCETMLSSTESATYAQTTAAKIVSECRRPGMLRDMRGWEEVAKKH